MRPRTGSPRRLGIVLCALTTATAAGLLAVDRGQLMPAEALTPPATESPVLDTAPTSTTVTSAVVVDDDDDDDGRVTTETLPAEPAVDNVPWTEQLGEPGRTFLGVSTEGDTTEEIEAFAVAAGRLPDVVMVSRDWASGGFDLATAERLADAGHLPMIAWEPWDHRQVLDGDRLRAVQPAYSLSTIIDGAHDEVIRDWARGAARWGRPLAIRLAHEMNGYWYPWAESANGNQPGEFVAAWRHIHALFEQEGATNVVWVWSPNLSQPALTPLEQLWPGDDYVDWVGLVGYLGNGIDPTVWTPTFEELFGPTLAEIRAFTTRPVVITEIGATEDGGRKAEWVEAILTAVAARDDVVGLMWFEIDKETDWRIVSSPEARAAFAAGVADDSRWGIPRDGVPTSRLVPDTGP